MPFKDTTRRREYDMAYKRKRRSQGWTKKGVDKRLTQLKLETADDLLNLVKEVVIETHDDASLSAETRLRIKLRAVEIGLRVIEITDHERRLEALEEREYERAPVEN